MQNNSYKLTVTQLNEYVSAMLKGDELLSDVWVSGELSGFKRHSSGHLYFSIKDEGALIRCIMFRQNAYMLDFHPEDGQSVSVRGSVSIYVKDGQYQLYASSMRREGEGELYRRFMLMKIRLEAKGYFDPAHKKTIPLLPKCIGIITSPTGAAVQDIINITRRRFPSMDILMYPVRVQGGGAAEEIAGAIAEMNRIKKADVLIVGRGGGSMEDLWCFNEEIVAKAIYKSNIPIVSAVGHETDFSIADFTADMRASTPSTAAELCVPEYQRLLDDILSAKYSLTLYSKGRIEAMKRELSGITDSSAFYSVRHRLDNLKNRLHIQRTDMENTARNRLVNSMHDIEKQASKIDALSPKNVLNRGYGMVQKGGSFISGVSVLNPKDSARLIMRDGYADITIKDILPQGSKNDTFKR